MLIEVKEIACLSRLSGYVSQLSRKELNKLDKLIAEQEATPDNFRQAVARAIAALPPEGGLKGMLKAVWRRLPGR
jgi:hypothetical protein